MEMRSSLEASRAGADIMADNHIDFKYLSYVQDNPCVLITVILSVGFELSGKPEDLQKNRYHRPPSARRNGKKQHLKFSNKCG
jgi:hypothetical protein